MIEEELFVNFTSLLGLGIAIRDEREQIFVAGLILGQCDDAPCGLLSLRADPELGTENGLNALGEAGLIKLDQRK